MENRESNLLAIRPKLLNARVSENMSNDEQFQNKTIRPIVKLQGDLFIEVFKNYIKKRKNTFYELSLEKRMNFIENAVQKDMKFRNSLKGMIIGQFTVEEYLQYTQNSSALNKRMMSIVKERLQDNVQLLEYKVA
ncbi:glyoxalase [Aquimarina sp. AD10]|uniref:Glyoxalase n=1 Tax=Aquimarina aggregata TaxID=1642818 RepID=A0A162XEP2_9FLAO|nr:MULTISPECIES: glyoxalase [Aquimarina]AXT60154.1 glyoxalase [Aquimarina sp. AD10]KZS38592.1 glyoxalase [Aquimarina aggregata]RKN00052.1 glyoxalase [Aquimarina sp. AD10]